MRPRIVASVEGASFAPTAAVAHRDTDVGRSASHGHLHGDRTASFADL